MKEGIIFPLEAKMIITSKCGRKEPRLTLQTLYI